MAKKTFDDWVLDNEKLIKQQADDLIYDIQLEERIDEEKLEPKQRKSKRIQIQQQRNILNDAHNEHLNGQTKCTTKNKDISN